MQIGIVCIRSSMR